MYRGFRYLVLGIMVVVLMANKGLALQPLQPPHDESHHISCDDCHALSRGCFYNDPKAQEAMCRSCHNPTGITAAMSDVANPIVDKGHTTITCTACHDPHGPHTTEDPHLQGQTAENKKVIRDNISDYVSSVVGPSLFQLSSDHLAFDDNHPPWTGICQTYHTQTVHHTNDSAADHQHYIGSNCTACHRHENGFAPSKEFVHEPRLYYCSDCHWDSRPALPHPAAEDCANCHTDPGESWDVED